MPLHIPGDVGVGVQGKGGLGVPQNPGQGLGVHPGGQRVGGKSMAEIWICQAQTNII